jgi:hypothetical protein
LTLTHKNHWKTSKKHQFDALLGEKQFEKHFEKQKLIQCQTGRW